MVLYQRAEQAAPASAELGKIDLFIHDSLHSEHNVRFEMDLAWSALPPGGAIVVDDIDFKLGLPYLRRDPSEPPIHCLRI